MSSPKRLFQIYTKIVETGTASAAQLAEGLGVSERTIYRDIERLRAAGAPIDGERRSGYKLREWPEFPALFLNREELGVLVAGARATKAGSDPGQADAAESLLEKVREVVPAASHARLGLRR